MKFNQSECIAICLDIGLLGPKSNQFKINYDAVLAISSKTEANEGNNKLVEADMEVENETNNDVDDEFKYDIDEEYEDEVIGMICQNLERTLERKNGRDKLKYIIRKVLAKN